MFVDKALNLPVIGSSIGPAFRAAVLETPISHAYWRLAPLIHRRRRHAWSGYVDPLVDPFALVLVDPTRIVRFTGREFPIWTNRWSDFGRILEGDWDRREHPPVDPSYSGPDPSLYLADRFEETPVYQCLETHFVDSIPREETAFVQKVLHQARTGESNRSVWQHCSTVEEVREHCRNLDRLYADMRDRGCRSIRELNAQDGKPHHFRTVMKNEILIDIGRDGEPLFVTGRHRLSIAKILGMKRVPVAIAGRHAKWVQSKRACDRHDDKKQQPAHTAGDPLNAPW